MVFVFFGLVATAGSAHVQDEALRMLPVLAGVTMGALAAAILIANNLRDVDTDRAAGKITLAVRLGAERSVLAYRAALALAFLTLVPIALVDDSAWPLLALGSIVLAVPAARLVRTDADAPTLIAALVATARLQLVFGALLAVGLWISN
jgi:1,4-dihydroxy-2-naphthoate octaprenyltransferase